MFTKLPPDIAGPFIRTAFPRYYAFIIASAGIGAVGFFVRGQTSAAIALLLIVLLTFWLWFWLIPHLNALRDAGNTAGFNRGHRLSVWLNAVELITALVLLGPFCPEEQIQRCFYKEKNQKIFSNQRFSLMKVAGAKRSRLQDKKNFCAAFLKAAAY